MKRVAIGCLSMFSALVAWAGLFDSISKGLKDAAQSVEKAGDSVNAIIQPAASAEESSKEIVSAPQKTFESNAPTLLDGKTMTSDEQRREEWRKMQEEKKAQEAIPRNQRAEQERKEYAARYAAQQKAEQDRLTQMKVEEDRVRMKAEQEKAAAEKEEAAQRAKEEVAAQKAREAKIAAARKDAEETKARRERIRINKSKESSITGTENIKRRVGEIFEEELQPLFDRKKRSLGYSDNYGKEDFIKDCCTGVSENAWIRKAHDYVPQAISFYQLGRFEDKMTREDIKGELQAMGFSEAQVGRLMSQYADWKEQGMGSDSQFLQTAREQAPKKKTAPKNYKLTKEDKKVNNEIRDAFATKLAWRLKAKGSSDDDIKQLRETMIEQLMEYSADVRLQRAEYSMNEIVRMYNL